MVLFFFDTFACPSDSRCNSRSQKVSNQQNLHLSWSVGLLECSQGHMKHSQKILLLSHSQLLLSEVYLAPTSCWLQRQQWVNYTISLQGMPLHLLVYPKYAQVSQISEGLAFQQGQARFLIILCLDIVETNQADFVENQEVAFPLCMLSGKVYIFIVRGVLDFCPFCIVIFSFLASYNFSIFHDFVDGNIGCVLYSETC